MKLCWTCSWFLSLLLIIIRFWFIKTNPACLTSHMQFLIVLPVRFFSHFHSRFSGLFFLQFLPNKPSFAVAFLFTHSCSSPNRIWFSSTWMEWTETVQSISVCLWRYGTTGCTVECVIALDWKRRRCKTSYWGRNGNRMEKGVTSRHCVVMEVKRNCLRPFSNGYNRMWLCCNQMINCLFVCLFVKKVFEMDIFGIIYKLYMTDEQKHRLTYSRTDWTNETLQSICI